MAPIKLYLDHDFDRLGFDRSTLSSEDIELLGTERLTGATILGVVAMYVGGKILDKATNGALDRALDEIVSFAESKENRVRLELEAQDLDPRVTTFIASVESMERKQFRVALRSIPLLRALVKRVLGSNDEHWRELVFLWDDEAWQFSFGITSDGEIVDDLEQMN